MNNTLEFNIAANTFFQGMKPEHLEIVTSSARLVRFDADELLFREGEPANRFFLIQSGRVALEAHRPADGTVPVTTIGAGDVLGWSWLFPPFAWHLQARALEPIEAIAVDGAHLLITAERDHEFGYEMMKRVAQILIHRLQAARDLAFLHQTQALLAC